jgi:hypothetical protein
LPLFGLLFLPLFSWLIIAGHRKRPACSSALLQHFSSVAPGSCITEPSTATGWLCEHRATG